MLFSNFLPHVLKYPTDKKESFFFPSDRICYQQWQQNRIQPPPARSARSKISLLVLQISTRIIFRILASYQLKMEHGGTTSKIFSEEKTTNSIVQITNILFSSDFVDMFLSLNDNKSCLNHELGGLPKEFWADVTEAMNVSSDDNDSALKVVLSEEDPRYKEIMNLDLCKFNLMTTGSIKKKVNALLKVRKLIQKNMTTISGEHDSDEYNFVEVAMKNIPGKGGLSLLGCYYFL